MTSNKSGVTNNNTPIINKVTIDSR